MGSAGRSPRGGEELDVGIPAARLGIDYPNNSVGPVVALLQTMLDECQRSIIERARPLFTNDASLASPPVNIKSERVAAALRQEIMDGLWPAGARLGQTEVANRLGVSTTPVREALVALSREGLVLADEHRGAVVLSPTPEDVRDKYAIRVELECLAAQNAVPKLTDDDVAELVTLLETMRSSTLHERVSLDRGFHLRLYSVAAMPRLQTLIENLRDATVACLRLVAVRASLMEHDAAQTEHEGIIEACRLRNAERTVGLIADHLASTAEMADAQLRARQ